MSMYPRTEYEMTEEDLATLLAAMKPVAHIMIGGSFPSSQQENANRAWAALGLKMGFDPMSVRPFEGKGNRSFTAVPSETEEARKERLADEASLRNHQEIGRLQEEIAQKQARVAELKDIESLD